MGTDVNKQGYPRTDIKKDFEYQIYCGGMGGGNAVYQAGQTYLKFLVKNDRFSVRNKRLIIRNLNFVVFSQATLVGGLYQPVAGTEVPLKAWAFVDDLPEANTTDPKYMAGGIACPAVPPYDVVFDGRNLGADIVEGDLPQPGDPGYRQYSSIYFFFGNPNYWWYGDALGNPPFNTMQILKQDMETKQ